MLKRSLAAALPVLVIAAVIGSISVAGADNVRPLNLLDVASPINSFIHLGPGTGPSTGDVQVFRDTLVWSDDDSPAGTAEGRCTLIDPSAREFECTIVTTLQRGTITTEGVGVLAAGATSIAAITGGTGLYENAGGTATLVFHPNGGPSTVTFALTTADRIS